MLLIRLLAVFLVFIANTWLLRSNALSLYKRSLARQADRELSRLAGEPCAVSGVWRSRRQPSSHSPTQQRPPAARTRTHTSRRELYTVKSARAVCAGGCGLEAGARGFAPAGEEEKGGRGDAEIVAGREGGEYFGSPGSSTDNQREQNEVGASGGQSVLKDAVSSARAPRDPRSRFTRSLHGTFRYEEEGNSSWEKVAPFSSTDSRGLRVLQRLQQGDEDQSSTATPESVTEDYSDEVQEGDTWGSPVPRVPPSWMTALYFNGRREQLKVKLPAGVELPRATFSLELWVKAEGGQSNPAVIAGVFDNCSHSLSEKGWSVGIRTVETAGTRDARFYFTLRTDRAVKSTTVHSHQRYRANVWTHLMAAYNGHNMTLYVDGAKVGESSHQSGNLYSPFMKACRTLFLGSNQSDQGQSFRGHVGGVVLWGYARSHADLLKRPLQIDMSEPVLAMWADFTNVILLSNFIFIYPVPEPELVSSFLPPPCGLTPCDNIDIISGYNDNWQLRTPKRIRYRIVNLSNDDGGNPTVTEAQIQLQHQALTQAFRPYNITLDLSAYTVKNSSLRERFILSNCRIAKIGNRQCDPECDHPRTGHDGGDCLRVGPCNNWKRQDGVCNMECNSIHYDYDDGDCCDPDVTDVLKTCFDPDSPDRAYISVKELKEELQLSGTDTLNVFFASNSMREELAGAATWPWAKEALTHQGGMVLNPSYFGTTGHSNTMIHEMGHIFGLYHVFKGVSERDSCDDPCQETTPSMETGDLCADTAPTPKSKACHDPGAVNDTCGVTTYLNTPYSNYMSYTDDNCTNHFTPNQVARMHCYLDLVYQKWLMDRQPAPIPLAPIVTDQSADSVSIYWLPPIRGSLYQRYDCMNCEKDGIFHQYAYEASSTRLCDTSGYWTPDEATGQSKHAFCDFLHTFCLPKWENVFVGDVLHNSPTFYPVADNPAIANIELISDTGKSINLGPQHVFCDLPLTMRLDTHNVAIAAIKLCTFDEKMEIDAAMLSSGPGSPLCSSCQPLLYHIRRQPPFTSKAPLPQTQQTFTDRFVTQGVKYKYTIQVEADGQLSDASPPLLYTHGQPYCGDGLIQGTEECDDSNLLDGDGCSKRCGKEMGFKCNGEPSQCYVFDGDGVCEEFERSSSVQDCGYFTPLGYTDQWATTATASHQDRTRCPAHAATGEPSLTKRAEATNKSTIYISRKAELECFHGSWDRAVSCQPVDCGFPDQSHVYHAIFSCPWGTTFGKQCSFTCGSPAILQGDSDRLVCLEDGLWSFPEAYCKIECPEVPSMSNAKLLTADCLASGHDVGSVCRYKCKPGFYVLGSLKKKIRRKHFKLECLEGGQWEETGCEPIACPAPPDIFQGMYTCTNGLYYDTVCTLQCSDTTKNIEIRCTKDGEWTAEFVMCPNLQGSCSAPPDLNSVEYSCDHGMDVGAECYPTCIMAVDLDLHDPVVLPNGTTVKSLKHWMVPKKVQSIVCTGMMKWYPDPQHIHCIQSCEPFGGDGWCDTINNRAYCQYDGGDCCPSTLSTRKVIQFGADCNQDECTCRDPDAEENKSKAKHLEGGGTQ
uniref:Pappalysin 2 n=1 Tax=Neolamprologus brichardi TaxID=32507 RepID=A0A3Q4GFM3_NEOBR